ncbi:MAG: hypothetical protein DHS20C01_22870 [marine bacterium B5-7]|nr:MAG: hypothetical protein DHS20C01_22870 [marine bacterium B5-7]
MKRPARTFTIFVFVICAMACGFGIAAWTGARYMVPPGSGLAGPLMVLGYGIVGALIGGGCGFILGIKLPPRTFRLLAFPVIIAGFILIAVISVKFLKSQAEQNAYLDEQLASLPPFKLDLKYSGQGDLAPFQSFAYDSSSGRFVTTTNEGDSCQGQIAGTSKAKVTMLAALRHVEIRLANDPQLCTNKTAEPLARLTFTITEHLPPATTGDVRLTSECLTDAVEIEDAISSIAAVHEQFRKDCK